MTMKYAREKPKCRSTFQLLPFTLVSRCDNDLIACHTAPMDSLEELQARHRKEQRDLQARITNKKKNASKKNRKAINDECAQLEHQLKETQARELAELRGEPAADTEENLEAQDGLSLEDEKGKKADVVEPSTNGVAHQFDTMTLSESPQPTNQNQPKKKNRQKERLARRAAEQEAAATKAEEEASNMVDHRSIEKTYMLKEFKAQSLLEKEIQPDGHCLFSAVADQLQQRGVSLVDNDQKQGAVSYKLVRRAAAAYMDSHPEDFAPFLDEPLKSYTDKIRDTAEWGGQLELVALANTYNVQIAVIQDGRTETIEPTEKASADPEKIWLAYYKHGYGLGEHYNSLRKAP
jgi:OTU domain-containing protein 6